MFDERALARIFEAKGRPQDNPLIVHIADVAQIGQLAASVPTFAKKLIDKFFPGPLTVVLPKASGVSNVASAGLDTIGIRMPGNDLARDFLHECGTPVAAPSANRSGRPSATTWQAVLEDLDGRIDCVLQADESTEIGLESTVVDCSTEPPVVLRSGSVTVEQLRKVVADIRVADAHFPHTNRSPGTRHAHYAPRARVLIVSDVYSISPAGRAAYIGMTKPAAEFQLQMVCASVDEYGRGLFEFFRTCDRAGVDVIYCEAVDDDGVGAAVMDRIGRAEQR